MPLALNLRCAERENFNGVHVALAFIWIAMLTVTGNRTHAGLKCFQGTWQLQST